MEKLDPIRASKIIGAKLSADLRKKIIIPQEKKDIFESTEAPSPEAFVNDDKKGKIRKTKPELTVLSNEEKDKKIENFFGKGVTTGVVTKEPPVPKNMNTSEKIQAYMDTQQSDYEKAAGIKPMSFQKRMEMKEKKEQGEEEKIKQEEARKNEKLLGLEKEVDEARKAFVGKDIEAEKKSSKFWKLFRVGSLGEYGEEHKGAKEEYYAALRAYKDEYLNIHGLNEKSVAEMVTFFNIKEHYSLESARLDADNENAGWPKKIWNGYMGMIDRYRKIGENDSSKFKKYSKKIVVGMFVALAATGLAAGGGAVAGVAGTITGASLVRGFTIGVSSAGYKAIYEGIAQGSRKRESRKEAEEIMKHSKVEGMEEMHLDLVNENLDNKIALIDEVMQEQKQWKRFRTFAAVGTAVVISQAGRYFGKWASEKASHWFGGTGTPMPEDTGAHEAGTVSPDNAPGGAGAPEVIPPIEKTIDLPAIEEGGSIEGSIIKHLTDNPDLIDKYNEQLGSGRKFDAGQIAHRMFEEYGDNRDLVHAGAQVQLSPDSLHIQGVAGDESMGFLHENAAADIPTEPEIEAVPDNIPPEANVFPENPGFDRAHESIFGHNTDNFLDSAERGYGGNYGPAANRNFFSSFRGYVVSGNTEAATKVFQNEIAKGEKWNIIKDMAVSEATNKAGWRGSRVEELFKNMQKVLGTSLKPNIFPREETVEAWTKRVAETAVEQANKKY